MFPPRYAALVTLANVVDPAGNFAFVERVLRMDTTLGRRTLVSRAIENPVLHRLAFGLIGAAEVTVAGPCLWGVTRLALCFGIASTETLILSVFSSDAYRVFL